MEKLNVKDKYPVMNLTLKKSELVHDTVDSIIEYYKEKIEANPTAKFIAIFDHYDHTVSLPEHEVAEGIVDAKNIVFCFGQKIPSPMIVGLRPRSIGITDCGDVMHINFLEVPMPPLNELMIEWTNALKK
jgi:hypothetical protein